MAKRKVFQYMRPGGDEWKEVFWDDRRAVHYFLWTNRRFDLRVIEVDEPNIDVGDGWVTPEFRWKVVSDRLTNKTAAGVLYYTRVIECISRDTGTVAHVIKAESQIEENIAKFNSN